MKKHEKDQGFTCFHTYPSQMQSYLGGLLAGLAAGEARVPDLQGKGRHIVRWWMFGMLRGSCFVQKTIYGCPSLPKTATKTVQLVLRCKVLCK